MTSRVQPLPLAAGTHLADFVADSVPVYHNSGPVPNNAYRTGAVGVQVDISSYFIVSRLLEAARLQHLLSAAASSTPGERLHPVLIHGATCAALLQLGAPEDVTQAARAVIAVLAAKSPAPGLRPTRAVVDSAIAAIVLLRDVLRDRQLLAPFHGLVSCVPYDYVKEHKPMPWLSCRANDRVAPLAWGLVAIACASPPILLLNRQPSLMWFRFNHSFMVRWFGTAATTAATGATR